MRITILDGRHLVGRFMAFDRHMNIVLGDAEEFRRLPPKKGVPEADREIRRPLGLVLIRGEEVISLTVEGPPPTDDRRGKRDVAPVRPRALTRLLAPRLCVHAREVAGGVGGRCLASGLAALAPALVSCRDRAAGKGSLGLGHSAGESVTDAHVNARRLDREAARRLAAACPRPRLVRCRRVSLALCAALAGLALRRCARRCEERACASASRRTPRNSPRARCGVQARAAKPACCHLGDDAAC
jgi:small nuclear ribonucleoprotein (snRNP)-like protein